MNGVRMCHSAVSNWPIVSAPDPNLGSKMVEWQLPRRTEVHPKSHIDHTRREKSATNLTVFHNIKMNCERNIADGGKAK